jgi:DNA-binding NarL/FixJ family response regulator/class 3 adenylate cyclase
VSGPQEPAGAAPADPVTFFFTDVEGSTRLVQQLGDGYGGVLDRIRARLREAIAAHAGTEIDCRGDELFAAFPEAQPAVEASLAAQRSLNRDAWPEETAVRVRMGIHSGRASAGPAGYVGLDVHRAARVCSAGHGGQVLLSGAAAARVEDVRLLDLGEHELPGLPEPERIFQLVADDLPSSFPALRNARAVVPALRVVIADDSVLLREGVARLLEDAGIEVAAQSGTAEDLLRHVGLHKPDVAIVDIRMPPTQTDEGLRAAREIRERFPGTGVLVLSQYVEPAYALELLGDTAKGVGYLLKDRVGDVEEFAAAVRRVADGGSALDPAVVQMLVGRTRRDDPLDELSPREREVLELMAEGRTNQAIAERLFITLRGVERHVTSIFGKLRLPATSDDHRRVLAVLTYLRS